MQGGDSTSFGEKLNHQWLIDVGHLHPVFHKVQKFFECHI